MSKILITGASGFIGRHLAAQLACEHSVIALGRSPVDGPWEQFITYDVASGVALPDSALEGVDTLFHLASKAHALSEKVGAVDGYDEVIVEGTTAVVRAAEHAGVRALVYLSSVKAMGEGGDRLVQTKPIDEAASTTPSTPYGKAKLAAERIVFASAIPHVVILRPVMVYGPGHKGNLDRMAEAIRRKRFPPIAENGNRRSMVHVDNLTKACIAVANAPATNRKTYILAEPNPRSTRQLYDQLRVEMGLPAVQWSIPGCLLKVAALGGDLLGRLSGRRMPLDSDSLQKLLGSAWYDGSAIEHDTDFRYRESHALINAPQSGEWWESGKVEWLSD